MAIMICLVLYYPAAQHWISGVSRAGVTGFIPFPPLMIADTVRDLQRHPGRILLQP